MISNWSLPVAAWDKLFSSELDEVKSLASSHLSERPACINTMLLKLFSDMLLFRQDAVDAAGSNAHNLPLSPIIFAMFNAYSPKLAPISIARIPCRTKWRTKLISSSNQSCCSCKTKVVICCGDLGTVTRMPLVRVMLEIGRAHV